MYGLKPSASSGKRRLGLHVLAVCLVVLIIFFGGFTARCHHLVGCEKQTEANAMLIEEAIGRWFIYQGDSPDDLVQLVERGYLAAMPVNPYSGVAMRSVPLDSQNVPGEYTYLKGYPITPEGGLGLSSYALLVYGHGSYRCEFMDYLGLGSNVLHASGQHVLFQDWDKDGDWMDGITGPEVPEEGLIRLYRSECSTDWVKRAQDLPAPAPRAPQG